MATNSFFKISYFFSLVPSLIICGAWWFAATRKRHVSLFFWLAGTHSFSVAVSVLQMVNAFSAPQNLARLQSLSAVNMLTHLALAGLYVALVRWLVNQPDERS